MSGTPDPLGNSGAAQFAREGLVVAAQPIAEVSLSLLRSTCERLAARPRTLRPELLSGIHNPFARIARTVDSWSLIELCQSPGLLDMVEALIGPDIVLWESELIYEPPGRPPQPALHRSPKYWPIEPPCGLTVRIAITSSRPETGGMFYTPDNRTSSLNLILRPGEFAVHDVGLRHGHHENRSDQARAEYIIRYMPADACFNRDPRFPPNRRAAAQVPLVNYTERPIWLVRGTDRADNDFVTGFAPTVGQWTSAPW